MFHYPCILHVYFLFRADVLMPVVETETMDKGWGETERGVLYDGVQVKETGWFGFHTG